MPVGADRIGQAPLVSVLVPVGPDAVHLDDCLESLTAQTLPHPDLEVILARYGRGHARSSRPTDGDGARDGICVRVLELGAADRRTAVGSAVGSARGHYVTVVDAENWVTPSYLQRLLAAAQPGVLPIACTGILAAGPGTGADPDLDLPVSAELKSHAGNRVAARLVPRVLDAFEGVLAPTELARSTLRSAQHIGPAAFWVGVLGAGAADFHVIRPEDSLHLRRDRLPDVRPPGDWADVELCLDDLKVLQQNADKSGAAPVVRVRLDEVADLLNGYLRQHPEDHPRLRAAARERGLTTLRWSRVNAGLARDLAVLYCFTPFVDTNAIVTARRLLERGVVTDVISQDLYHLLPRDLLTEQISAEVVDRSLALSGPAHMIRWSETRDFAARVLQAVEELEAEKGPYSSLFSSAMQIPSHFAAAAVKLHRPDLHWTAEFLEPLRRNPDGVDRVGDLEDDWLYRDLQHAMAVAGYPQRHPSRTTFEWAELVAYALADELLFTSETQLEHMLEYCRDRSLARRVRSLSTVRHPTVPAPELYHLRSAGYPLDPAVMNIGYFGAFYGRRGLGEVTAALRLLEPEERDRIRLHVFTKPYERMSIEILQAGLADVVTVSPYIAYLTFLNLATKFDVLLVNDLSTADLPTTNPYLPSKIFDYRGSGTPIWAIQEAGSALSSLPADYISRLGDVDDALSQLRRMLRDRAPRVADAVDSHPHPR